MTTITAGKKFTRSDEWWAEGALLIPAGTQTLSKGPNQYVQGVSPKYLERGKGCRVWDADGNEYLDYEMGVLPITLGYAYPRVDRAIQEQLKKGITFSLMHPLEVLVARQLVQIVPCAQMVRFGKNGSDVTSAAVRLARAYTGRDKVACCGYHGWQDWYIASTARNKGVPKAVRELTLAFRYNDIDSLKKLFAQNRGSIAAVILEPMDIEIPAEGFLQRVKEVTKENGAVLIFDEIKTGFRMAIAGMQEYSGVVPDLAAFGKGMANGMPVSALVGSRRIMEYFQDVFFSFTFGGEALSLAAAQAAISEYREKDVIGHLWKVGRLLQEGYTAIVRKLGIEKMTQCKGLPPTTMLSFKNAHGKDDLVLKSLFQQEVVKRGILFRGRHNLCFSHQVKDIEETLSVYEEVLALLKKAVARGNPAGVLEGPPVVDIFKKEE